LIWFYEEETTFPMPAELKPLAERARRERTARSEIRRGLVMWKCPVCAWTMSGHLTLEDRAPRFCRSTGRPQMGEGVMCGASLVILHDER
jgi:hypothetical protein